MALVAVGEGAGARDRGWGQDKAGAAPLIFGAAISPLSTTTSELGDDDMRRTMILEDEDVCDKRYTDELMNLMDPMKMKREEGRVDWLRIQVDERQG